MCRRRTPCGVGKRGTPNACHLRGTHTTNARQIGVHLHGHGNDSAKRSRSCQAVSSHPRCAHTGPRVRREGPSLAPVHMTLLNPLPRLPGRLARNIHARRHQKPCPQLSYMPTFFPSIPSVFLGIFHPSATSYFSFSQ